MPLAMAALRCERVALRCTSGDAVRRQRCAACKARQLARRWPSSRSESAAASTRRRGTRRRRSDQGAHHLRPLLGLTNQARPLLRLPISGRLRRRRPRDLAERHAVRATLPMRIANGFPADVAGRAQVRQLRAVVCMHVRTRCGNSALAQAFADTRWRRIRPS